MTPTRLDRIRVAGFRSLRDVSLDLTPVTVLIGPNGGGKSNLMAALTLAERCAAGFLPLYVGLNGGASYLVHRSPKGEQRIAIDLELRDGTDRIAYSITLVPTASDALAFESERVGLARADGVFDWQELGRGHLESLLSRQDGEPTVRKARQLLRGIRLYHFHDTSRLSELRTNARQADDRVLAEAGGNLAATWLRWKASTDPGERTAVESIETALRMVVPGIRSLEPVSLPGDAVRLDWFDDQGQQMQVAHLSDGALRLIALLTAFGQPPGNRPPVIGVDEPELGLHPAALELFVEWIRSASIGSQVIVATQSPALLGPFDADEVVVVEREQGTTVLRRKSAAELAGWLSDYSLAELYGMNVLGGRP